MIVEYVGIGGQPGELVYGPCPVCGEYELHAGDMATRAEIEHRLLRHAMQCFPIEHDIQRFPLSLASTR